MTLMTCAPVAGRRRGCVGVESVEEVAGCATDRRSTAGPDGSDPARPETRVGLDSLQVLRGCNVRGTALVLRELREGSAR